MNRNTTARQGPMPEDQFLQDVKRSLLRIEAELLQVALPLPNYELIKQMYRQFHLIAGAASLMGFPSIMQIAQEGEMLLEKILDGEVQLTEQILSFLQHALKQLWRVVDN